MATSRARHLWLSALPRGPALADLLIERPGTFGLAGFRVIKLSFADSVKQQFKNECLVVSHRWDEHWHPDPNGTQLRCLIDHLKAKLEIKWVWIDCTAFSRSYRLPPSLPLPDLTRSSTRLVERRHVHAAEHPARGPGGR